MDRLMAITGLSKQCKDISDELRYRLAVTDSGMDCDSIAKEFIAAVDRKPSILSQKMVDSNLRHGLRKSVFDFIYDIALYARSLRWMNVLTTVVTKVTTDRGQEWASEIIHNPLYVLRLQESMYSHSDIFELLITNDFASGNLEFLVYSLIARDEKEKLKILCLHGLTDTIVAYRGIFDIALRFGRSDVIKFLLETLREATGKVTISKYGRILDQENYEHGHKYVYYTGSLMRSVTEDYDTPKVIGSTQNYAVAFELIFNAGYSKPITVHTVHVWCDILREKKYKWDVLTIDTITDNICPRITSGIKVEEDFGEYNRYIFSDAWSDRKTLIDYCKTLEEKVSELSDRCDYMRNSFDGNT